MLLIGLVFFCFLLVLFWSGIVWIVGKIGKSKGEEQKYRKYTAYLGIFIAVATVLFLIGDEIYTNKQFKALCEKEAGIKTYKTVNNVNVVLFFQTYPRISDISTYELTNGNYVDFTKFNYIEQPDNNHNVNPYKLKYYDTVNENGLYRVNNFIFVRNFNNVNKKELDFNNFIKIDSYYFNQEKYSFELTDKGIFPKSKYAYISSSRKIKHGYNEIKSAIIDINNYSVIAERKSFTNYGGTFMHIFSWLSSGYGSPIITDSCRTGLSYSEFISKILQPTVQ